MCIVVRKAVCIVGEKLFGRRTTHVTVAATVFIRWRILLAAGVGSGFQSADFASIRGTVCIAVELLRLHWRRLFILMGPEVGG